MSSPSSSPSLSSSACWQHAPQNPFQSFRYETYRPGAFHLTPCTVDQYFELPCGNDDKYELVDGLLWWKGEMDTYDHDEARDRIAEEIWQGYADQDHPGFEVVKGRSLHVSGSSQQVSNRSKSAATSSASDNDCCTIRRPDLAVFEPGRAPNRGDLSPRSNKITFPLNHPPFLAIEFTNPSTRNVDLHNKWDEYERTGIHCYVIVDLAATTDPSVIVGTLSNGTYSKSVFRDDDVVRGSLFDKLGFSAQYLLDPPRSVTEIYNSLARKFQNKIAHLEKEGREKERVLRENERVNREKASKIADLERQIDAVTNG